MTPTPAAGPRTPEPLNVAGGPLLEPHDGGCTCWPHVAQSDAFKAVEHAALMEYRSKAEARDGLDVAALIEAMWTADALEWTDSDQVDETTFVGKVPEVAERIAAAYGGQAGEPYTGYIDEFGDERQGAQAGEDIEGLRALARRGVAAVEDERAERQAGEERLRAALTRFRDALIDSYRNKSIAINEGHIRDIYADQIAALRESREGSGG